MTRVLGWSSILYRNLLRVCPAELRQEFGQEMTLVFEDDLRESWLEGGVRGFAGVWRRAAFELLRAGLSQACAAPSALVALISLVTSALCLGGELALARAHATASTSSFFLAEASFAEAVLAVVVWPSLTAAFVSFTAARAGTRIVPLRLREGEDAHTPAMERL